MIGGRCIIVGVNSRKWMIFLYKIPHLRDYPAGIFQLPHFFKNPITNYGAITNGHWPNWSLTEVVTTRVVTDHNGHRTGGHRPKRSLTQVVTKIKFEK